MKKILSATLALAMTLSLLPAAFAAGGTAYASTQAVEVDGKKVEFQMYALKDAAGNPTNYVKLRDVAHVLNGTKAQFSVGYDGSISVTTGQPYADAGGEMTTPYSGDRAYRDGSGSVKVNGQSASLESIILTDDAGGDYTYFKLRDLGTALGFQVDWSADRGVFLNTGGSTQPTQPANPLDLFQGAWKGSFQSADGKAVSEELILTGDQFERVGVYNDAYYYAKGTVLVQTNMVNSSDGITYPYVLTLTAKEGLGSDRTMQPHEETTYYYVKSVDSNAGQINWHFSTYTKTNSAASDSIYTAVQAILAAGPSKPSAPDDTDINPMNYAYTAMDYLYDHLKFPSTMDVSAVKCGKHVSNHIFEKTDNVYVVTITYKAANSFGALRTSNYVTMFNLTTGKTMFDAVGYTESMIDGSWGAAKSKAYKKNIEARGLSGGGTLSTELTREQIQSLVDQIKK